MMLIKENAERLIYGWDEFNDMDLICEFASDQEIAQGKAHISEDCENKNKDVIMYDKNGQKLHPFFASSIGRNGIQLVCDIPPHVTLKECTNSNVVYSVCSYTCDGGLIPTNTTSACSPAGSWDNLSAVFSNQMACVSVSVNENEVPVTADEGMGLLILIPIMMFVMFMICAICYQIRQSRQQRKKQPSLPTGWRSLCYELFSYEEVNEVYHNEVCYTGISYLLKQSEKFIQDLCFEIECNPTQIDKPNMMKLAKQLKDKLGLSERAIEVMQANPTYLKNDTTKPALGWLHLFSHHGIEIGVLVNYFKDCSSAKQLLLLHHDDCVYCNSI